MNFALFIILKCIIRPSEKLTFRKIEHDDLFFAFISMPIFFGGVGNSFFSAVALAFLQFAIC